MTTRSGLSSSLRSMFDRTFTIQRRPGDSDPDVRTEDRYGNPVDRYEDVGDRPDCPNGRLEPLDPRAAEPYLTGGDNASRAAFRIFLAPGEDVERTDRLVEYDADGEISHWYSIHSVDLIVDTRGNDHHFEIVGSETS